MLLCDGDLYCILLTMSVLRLAMERTCYNVGYAGLARLIVVTQIWLGFAYCLFLPIGLSAVNHRPSTCCCRCRNFDGGFGCIPGAESHSGQIFTCVGALSIAGSLDLVDEGKHLSTPCYGEHPGRRTHSIVRFHGRRAFYWPNRLSLRSRGAPIGID